MSLKTFIVGNIVLTGGGEQENSFRFINHKNVGLVFFRFFLGEIGIFSVLIIEEVLFTGRAVCECMEK